MVGTGHSMFAKTYRMYDTKSELNPNVNYGLSLVSYQYWLISCNKYAALMQDVSNRRPWGKGGGIWELSALSAPFYYKPKTALKNTVHFLKTSPDTAMCPYGAKLAGWEPLLGGQAESLPLLCWCLRWTHSVISGRTSRWSEFSQCAQTVGTPLETPPFIRGASEEIS